MAIPFTQFLMPDGRRRSVTAPCTPEIQAMADKLLEAGYWFEVEMLGLNQQVSAEVLRPCREDPEVVASFLCPNGPMIPLKVEEMVKTAFAALNTK